MTFTTSFSGLASFAPMASPSEKPSCEGLTPAEIAARRAGFIEDALDIPRGAGFVG